MAVRKKTVADEPLPFAHSPWRGRIIGFGSAFIAGTIALFVAPAWITGTARAVAAYDAGTIALLVVLLGFGMHGNADLTERRASADDPGRNIVLLAVLAAVVAGLASAVVILGHGPHVHTQGQKIAIYVIGLIAVISGWTVIHALLTFRYAHLFYYDFNDDDKGDGGLSFPGTKRPSDYDFAYFSFVVGMTFQVSDVEVTDARVRRVVLYHGLISFAYNTAIVALVINLLSGLFH